MDSTLGMTRLVSEIMGRQSVAPCERRIAEECCAVSCSTPDGLSPHPEPDLRFDLDDGEEHGRDHSEARARQRAVVILPSVLTKTCLVAM